MSYEEEDTTPTLLHIRPLLLDSRSLSLDSRSLLRTYS